MKLSIGIPFYNARSTLADAIRSVFAQTYQQWELILLDDGSTDGSLQIAKSIRDPRVRVVSDGGNRGLIYRLNQLSDLARGEYYARMDADDLMHPERLEYQMAYMQSEPACDVLGAGMVYVKQDYEPLRLWHHDPRWLRPEYFIPHSPLAHVTVLARRAWFLENRYSAKFVRAEDHELWCRTLLAGHTGFHRLSQPLVFCRIAEAGSVASKWLGSLRSDRRIVSRFGPSTIGYPRTAYELAKSHAKSFIIRCTAPVGLASSVVGLSKRSLDVDEIAKYERVLADVLSADVPGIELSKQAASPQTRD